MSYRRHLCQRLAERLALCAVLGGFPLGASAQQELDGMRIGQADLGGVVTGANGPEAGVWVIAETADLPTNFTKIVVTDDQGRYLIPDLPEANYKVFVRGYGLIDSIPASAKPGKALNLTAVSAPNAKAAAQYYPAIYWYAMLNIPKEESFTGLERDKNMPANLTSQAQWLNIIKTTGCVACHALGTIGTRTIPKALGEFSSSTEAWERRIQSGQAMTQMTSVIGRLDTHLALTLFANWTDRIAAGELPAATPTRPQGVERNLVLTMWDWSRPTAYLHDEISTTGAGRRSTPAASSRNDRGKYRLPSDPRSDQKHRQRIKAPGSGSQHPILQGCPHGAIAILGGRAHLG